MLWNPEQEPQKPQIFALAQLAGPEPEHIRFRFRNTFGFGSGTGFGQDSNIKWSIKKSKIKNERPTFWETMLLVTLKKQDCIQIYF